MKDKTVSSSPPLSPSPSFSSSSYSSSSSSSSSSLFFFSEVNYHEATKPYLFHVFRQKLADQMSDFLDFCNSLARTSETGRSKM